MNDLGWTDLALRSARPRVLGALTRYFRDLDLAEEAFQEACLSALKNWPGQSPPHDPAAWLIFVGRNAAIDTVRRQSKLAPLPPDGALSDLEDTEADLAERLDDAHYRDDILRLLFICCHPDLPATQQIALALRIVSGLTVKEIARAFLVSEVAMEQRITRAKGHVADANVPFETPDEPERVKRVAGVAAVIYLMFNEGYSATGGDALIRASLCDEAIRLGRLLLRLFFGEPELMGLLSTTKTAGCGTAASLMKASRCSTKRFATKVPGRTRFRPPSRPCTPGPPAPKTPIGARSALRCPRKACAVARRQLEPRGCAVESARAGRRAGHDRAAGCQARQLFLLLRSEGHLADAAWPLGRRPERLRSCHRPRPHTRRGGAYSQPNRSLEGRAFRCTASCGFSLVRQTLKKNSSAVGSRLARSSLDNTPKQGEEMRMRAR